MKNYILKINLKSPIITPFSSDTIFGHIAWAFKYLYGAEFLNNFLSEYKNTLPLIISNGFPENFLPRPCSIPNSIKGEENLLSEFYNEKEIAGHTALKNLKKFTLIHIEILYKLINNYSDYELYNLVFSGECCPNNFREIPKEWKECAEPINNCQILNPDIMSPCPYIDKEIERALNAHNTINRITNNVLEEGGFYQHSEIYYKHGVNFDIYMKFQEKYLIQLKEAFDFISKSGYGKDKSTGKGSFDITEFSEFHFKKPDDADTFMSLSNFVPSENDPVNGSYSLITKFGKLGGDYAKSAVKGENQLIPFKKPLIMLEAGSFFEISNSNSEYFGCMIENIHKNEKIVHYGIAYPLYIKRGKNESI